MADKQKDSKIMSMLERSGILRKADGDTSGDRAPIEPDIKPLFDHDDEVVTVKTAPRQPVPGMSTPVFPQSKPPSSARETPAEAPISAPMPAPPPVHAPDPTPAPMAPAVASAPSQESAKQPSSFGPLNLFKNGDSPSASPTAAMEAVVRESSEPRPENYTDRYLNINELYDALALRSKKTDTIYLIEDYLQTLPGSLPDSQRRDIVAKILASSGFDYDLLMGDGVLRVKMLKEYAERFARHTDDYIAARQAELDELDQQMMRTRKLIENRKELHKKQFYTIEAEAQRLKEILTFISG